MSRHITLRNLVLAVLVALVSLPAFADAPPYAFQSCINCPLGYAVEDIPCGEVQVYAYSDDPCDDGSTRGYCYGRITGRTPEVRYVWYDRCETPAEDRHVTRTGCNALMRSVDPCASGSCPSSRVEWPPALALPGNPPPDAFGIWRSGDGALVALYLDRPGVLSDDGVLAFVFDAYTGEGSLTVDQLWSLIGDTEKPTETRWSAGDESGAILLGDNVALVSQDVVLPWMLVRDLVEHRWVAPTVTVLDGSGISETITESPRYKVWTAYRRLNSDQWTSRPSAVLTGHDVTYLGDPAPRKAEVGR
ncbi:MAG: hypothetical protein AAGN66_06965 [Acidobacteriota bacterium]